MYIGVLEGRAERNFWTKGGEGITFPRNYFHMMLLSPCLWFIYFLIILSKSIFGLFISLSEFSSLYLFLFYTFSDRLL